jgi:antagonist of KipI
LDSSSFKPRRVKKRVVLQLVVPQYLRVTPGPQADLFSGEASSVLTSSLYSVTEATNRMGLRLSGPRLKLERSCDIITEGVPLGAIQVPPDGQPIILFVEHQTTGGYPKIANVISADIHMVGQLRPRDIVRFELISLERAGELLAQQETLVSADSLESV